MQVFHVEKDIIVNLKGVLKLYLGLDLIDPRSSGF